MGKRESCVTKDVGECRCAVMLRYQRTCMHKICRKYTKILQYYYIEAKEKIHRKKENDDHVMTE